jgi:hypothetical protein
MDGVADGWAARDEQPIPPSLHQEITHAQRVKKGIKGLPDSLMQNATEFAAKLEVVIPLGARFSVEITGNLETQ